MPETYQLSWKDAAIAVDIVIALVLNRYSAVLPFWAILPLVSLALLLVGVWIWRVMAHGKFGVHMKKFPLSCLLLFLTLGSVIIEGIVSLESKLHVISSVQSTSTPEATPNKSPEPTLPSAAKVIPPVSSAIRHIENVPPKPDTQNVLPSSGIIGSDNTQVNDSRPIHGNGNTILGATDNRGNAIHNRGGTAIGNGAHADPTSIAIGAHARGGVQASPTYTQQCTNCSQAQGPNSQATYNQYGAPALTMTDAQRDAIRDAMKPYVGMSFLISRHDATPDSSEYADKLRDALVAAGLTCKLDMTGQVFTNGGVKPGVSFNIGRDDKDAASTLVKTMADLGLLHERLSIGVNQNVASQFQIVVAPNR